MEDLMEEIRRRREQEALPKTGLLAEIEERRNPTPQPEQFDPFNGMSDQARTMFKFGGHIKDAASNLPETISDAFTGNSKETEETRTLPELSEFGGKSFEGLSGGQQTQIMAGLMVTFDEDAQKDIIRSAVPEATFRVDDKGNTFVKFGENMPESVLNKAGMSGQDAKRLLTAALSFIPAGRVAMMATSLLGRLGLAAAANAGTDLAMQGATKLLGSEQDVDLWQTALAAGTGAGAEFLIPAVRTARAAASGVRNELLPSGTEREIIEAGERAGVPVRTTDVMPPQTIGGRLIQGAVEKIPFIGTGSGRAAQQTAREEAIPAIAREFGVNLDTPVEQQIVASLNRVQQGAIAVAKDFRTSAIDRMNTFGEISGQGLDDLIASVAAQSDELTRLTSTNSDATLRFFNQVGSDLIGANFGKMANVRTNVIEALEALKRGDFTNLPSSATARLTRLKVSIDDAMTGFAKRNDESAFQNWRKGNRIFAEEFGKARNSELRRIFANGDVKPEVVLPLIMSGTRSTLKRLFINLDDTGRANARGAIIQRALQEGFKGADNALTEVFNPARFTAFLKRENSRKAIQTFFRGDADTVINGFIKLMQATQQAQKAGITTPTGQSLQVLAGMAAGGAAVKLDAVLLSGLVTGTIASAGRIFESKAIRDLLVRLNAAPEGSAAFDRTLRRLIPLINSTAQVNNLQPE